MSSLLTGTNPVLTRELRASLRNTRSFVLLAVYVAVLGAVAVNQFPQTITIDTIGRNAGVAGRNLFWYFTACQAALVLVLLPALATGALAQEREQRTLQPLLLTPLTPMQIVWGKAGGVLSLALLLLLSTLPLTSLCFLLGGVSPGEVIAAYALLLGLATFTAGIGLYCSARWHTAMRAMVACYLILPWLTALLAVFAPIGMIVSGRFLLGRMIYALTVLWQRWATAPIPRRLGVLWWLLFAITLLILVSALLFIMVKSWGLGIFIVAIIFVTPYLIITSQWGLQQAAREIARNPDPEPALRERMEDMKEEWQRAVAPPPTVYLPAPTGQYTYTPQTPARPRRPQAATYGKQPFLPDHLNPVFAKDMRGGLVGKLDYLFRFSYVITIGSELLLLAVMSSDLSAGAAAAWFAGWARLHFTLLLIAGAWLGARTIAPEREQQTLPQLLTAPLRPGEIVGGKMMAAMVYTFYVFVLSLPLALLLPLLGEMTWWRAFSFIGVEIALGAFTAAWGIYCSMQCVTVRRAIGCALGGVLVLMLSPSLLSAVLPPVAYTTAGYASSGAYPALRPLVMLYQLLPFSVLNGVLPPPVAGNPLNASGAATSLPLALLLYGGGTLVLLSLTARAFKNYVRTV
ncbi:MAG TPA: ABC transporter permease subunit [Abditibacteriaceae bacterium]|nr:ABC transporter permease subunit [Abditibacteriaceae bacterium]